MSPLTNGRRGFFFKGQEVFALAFAYLPLGMSIADIKKFLI